MHSAILIIALGILAVIAHGDVQTRRIPNAFCIIIAALGLARIILDRNELAASYTFATAALTFGATFLLFFRGVIGGGDAKLVTAMSLLVGHQGMLCFLFLMSACGGALAIATVCRDMLGRGPRYTWSPANRELLQTTPSAGASEKSTVPYGVAIAAAGAITLMITR
jgi:prepilin peptidase CpaA